MGPGTQMTKKKWAKKMDKKKWTKKMNKKKMNKRNGQKMDKNLKIKFMLLGGAKKQKQEGGRS